MSQILCVRQLLALCSEREPRVACTVRRMAMASLAAVFRDITPRSALAWRERGCGICFSNNYSMYNYIAGVLR